MLSQHTLLESAIERRNHYQGRMVENMSNIIYFTKRKGAIIKDRDKMKLDSEERAALNKTIVEAERAIKSGKDNVEADKMLMSSFDELIVVLGEEAKPPKKKK